MHNLSTLTTDQVIEALAKPGPVAEEVRRLMFRYSEALARGVAMRDIILPGPETTGIEAVAMHLMHEALALRDDPDARPCPPQ